MQTKPKEYKRLIVAVPIPNEVNQVSNHLLSAEGYCTCGRLITTLDAKLVLLTAVPAKGVMIAGAYCLPCSNRINRCLASLKNVVYTGFDKERLQ